MHIEQTTLDNLSFPPLGKLVIEALQQHPTGLSEYELMQWIKQRGYHLFKNLQYWNRLSLFQNHFTLFHTLYQLKVVLWQNDIGCLEISPLKILLLPCSTNAGTSPEKHDPLQDYYLDLKHLQDTSDKDIGGLLEKFWQSLGNPDKRAAALAELELEDPVDFELIKKQHRRLVMKHHPDRGGDKEKLQSINRAMDILKQLQGKR